MGATIGSLAWSTYVAASKPIVAEHMPPRETREMWSPTSSTLIFEDRDAVLVDALLTMDEARALADWVAASGRNLTTIYITHGHGDHFADEGFAGGGAPRLRIRLIETIFERGAALIGLWMCYVQFHSV